MAPAEVRRGMAPAEGWRGVVREGSGSWRRRGMVPAEGRRGVAREGSGS